MEFAIGIDVPVFKAYYPLVSQTSTTVGTPPKVKYTVTMSDPGGSLGSELDGWVTELKNLDPSYTTCCIQMSHAINMSFHTTDPNKMVGVKSYRRPTRKFKIQAAANKEFHYIASVDEMKEFLDTTFESGEEISRLGDGKVASRAEAKVFHSRPTGNRVLHEQPVRRAPHRGLDRLRLASGLDERPHGSVRLAARVVLGHGHRARTADGVGRTQFS